MDQHKNSKYLWCTLVMCGDFYVPGALATAASVHRWSAYPICCMYTADDVTLAAVESLSRQFDCIRSVEYIDKRILNASWSSQQRIAYGSWMSKAFTKWNILDPSQFGEFEKIMFIDADFILTTNMDELFDLPVPSMTLSSPWAQPFTRFSAISNPYVGIKHGQAVDAYLLYEGLQSSFVGIGNLVLLSPAKVDWDTFKRLLTDVNAYGHCGCKSGVDEQAITDLYLVLRRPVHHIHQRFNWIAGKHSWLRPGDKPKSLHYQGSTKPWTLGRDKMIWEDLNVWWNYADDAIARDADAAKWFKVSIKSFKQEVT